MTLCVSQLIETGKLLYKLFWIDLYDVLAVIPVRWYVKQIVYVPHLANIIRTSSYFLITKRKNTKTTTRSVITPRFWACAKKRNNVNSKYWFSSCDQLFLILALLSSLANRVVTSENCLIPPATLGNPVYTESVHWSKIQKENGINIQWYNYGKHLFSP